MLEINENILITRAQHGETEAFGPLVRKYHHRLYTHINGRVKDVEIAKDLTQETWLRAFRGIRGFRCESAFSSWLYRIAENVCIDFFRKGPASANLDPLHTLDEQRMAYTHPDPCQAVLRQELHLHLKNAISELSPLRRLVFRLYYHEDLSIKTIAKRMKRSEGTIKTHLRNARLQLRESLTPYLKDEDIPWLAS